MIGHGGSGIRLHQLVKEAIEGKKDELPRLIKDAHPDLPDRETLSNHLQSQLTRNKNALKGRFNILHLYATGPSPFFLNTYPQS